MWREVALALCFVCVRVKRIVDLAGDDILSHRVSQALINALGIVVSFRDSGVSQAGFSPASLPIRTRLSSAPLGPATEATV